MLHVNWNFLGGEGVQNKKLSMGEVWIFSVTTQSAKQPKEVTSLKQWLLDRQATSKVNQILINLLPNTVYGISTC